MKLHKLAEATADSAALKHQTRFLMAVFDSNGTSTTYSRIDTLIRNVINGMLSFARNCTKL